MRLPFNTHIDKSREDTRVSDRNQTAEIRLYSDGSMQDGKVGTAAILLRQGRPPRHLQYHLGKEGQHTVYEAELVGMILAAHLAFTEPNSGHPTSLSVDNQAALTSASRIKPRSGQHLIKEFIRLARRLKQKHANTGYSLIIRWVAGHEGVEGNKLTDEKAKEAAAGTSSHKDHLPTYLRGNSPLLSDTSAMRQDYNGTLKTNWKEYWATSKRYARLNRIDPDLPSPSFLKLVRSGELTRGQASLLFQLRTGHVPLNRHLN
ncbi:hypothetical protein EW146_g4286 [Bondarzewia mesenterica]|uniref:RNase H type-1 domain-containing protein n=1 Tax=Bondarzewia mesenterica TaxID=1095465 RepID=A0A4S4LVJ1_9AGAM|nr:hypothetical protein EW146_g4286 [Bondarzewia mesenterica]